MASLPAQHPTLSLHLTDLTLTPLITSSSSRAHLDSLTSLASAALTASSAAMRANLGRPQRIMVEYPHAGPVLLQSFLHPDTTAAEHNDDRPNSAAAPAPAPGDDDAAVPVLVGVVVAPSRDEAREARRVAARLERVGRQFQREWAAQALDTADAADSLAS